MTPATIGRYEILEELGGGGMGRVVKARDVKLLRLVAIKIVPKGDDPSFFERLEREARAIALLSHHYIVTVYDVEQAGDVAYIVMEYVAGNTLQTRMRYVPPGEWGRFLQSLASCAEALDYAHRKGIIHRDVKPSNIMIGDDATPKLLDFGIAKVIASREASLTQSGTFVGTPLYMSPEQITGAVVGPAADQYSLAMIAYQLLAGRHPFGEGETMRLIYQITQQKPPPPSTFNSGIAGRTDAVILRALDKDPSKRFSSCAELFAELEESSSSAPQIVQSAPARAEAPAAVGKAVSWIWSAIGVALPYLGKLLATGPPPVAPVSVEPPVPVTAPPPKTIPPPQPSPGEFTQVYTRADQTAILRRQPEERLDPETIVKAQARELVEILDRRDFESAVALRGKWLPGVSGAGGELLAFSEAARYLGAAQDAISSHVRIEHLKRAGQILFTVGNQLLADAGPAARHLPDALEAWKNYARDLLSAAQQRASTELPNPFRAAQPLRPDQGRPLFRGRDDLVRSMEAILADANQSSSLALLGPRRCGKTSLLQMLPAMLPDCACVFFDLQDNPVSTVSEFFEALSRRAREQVRAQRQIELPELHGKGSFESATQWLNELDHFAGLNRILLSIDEFERLEALFPGDRGDLLRLMGLFRATIQHRRKVRLLVSGVAPFEELGPLWNDHFINVRELRIGHLDRETSVNLLRKPIPEFPEGGVPCEVAEKIFERTAGQPYLLQLFGTLLINRLNEEDRTQATLDDVPVVETEALSQGRYYFGNTYGDAPPDAREALDALALGEQPATTTHTRRWLEGRWLIDEEGRLRTPVLGAFIREELGA